MCALGWSVGLMYRARLGLFGWVHVSSNLQPADIGLLTESGRYRRIFPIAFIHTTGYLERSGKMCGTSKPLTLMLEI